MPEDRSTVEVVCGVPVVATPEEIDTKNAAELRAALLEASAQGRGRFVVDMSGTQFCDSAGLHVLVRAHKQSQAEGGELLLVVPAITVLRVLTITGVDRLIPNFSSLEEALAQASAARSARSRPALTGSEPSSARPPDMCRELPASPG
jgi:anti-sigma B factor antagonist